MAQAFKSFYLSEADGLSLTDDSQEIRIDLMTSETVEMLFVMNADYSANDAGTFGNTAVYITDNASDDTIA